jgi:hypothetical protein
LIEQREKHLTKLTEIKKTVDLVNHKIEVYANALLERERKWIEIEN